LKASSPEYRWQAKNREIFFRVLSSESDGETDKAQKNSCLSVLRKEEHEFSFRN